MSILFFIACGVLALGAAVAPTAEMTLILGAGAVGFACLGIYIAHLEEGRRR